MNNDIITPGSHTVVHYSEVLSELQDQVLTLYLVCGLFLFCYALFNMYVVSSEKFYDWNNELSEQITGCMDAIAVMFSLFVALTSLVTLYNINI